MPAIDFFMSYRRTKSQLVRKLVDALETYGRSVWFDQRDIDDFDEITPAIESALADSHCFVAWYTSDYPLSNACLHELEVALTHALSRDELGLRVLILNPTDTIEHIVPRTLRDLQVVSVPADPTRADLEEIAGRLSEARARVTTTLAREAPSRDPEWFGLGVRPGGTPLIGRRSELFEILATLHAKHRTIGVGHESVQLAQIVGMPGVGKTFLALEYGRRFGSMYPGGVFFFRAYGYDATEAALPQAQQDDARQRQLRTVLGYLDIHTQNAPPSDIDARAKTLLGSRGDYVWIIDDIPADFSPEDLRKWGAPTRNGRTLLTSRTSHLESIGRSILLRPLVAEDGLKMLGRFRAVRDVHEARSATELVERLGALPLALESIGARLMTESYAELVSAVSQPTGLFEPSGPAARALPTGHDRDLLRTFASSLQGASARVHRLLGFTSVLARAPIPFTLADACVPESGAAADPNARGDVRGAIRETGDRGLATIRDDDTFEVHALVQAAADAVLYGGEAPRTFSARAVSALCDMLPETVRFKARAELRLLYEHAGHLTRQIRDLPTAILMGRIGTYDVHLGNKKGDVAARERQRDWMEENLGVDHRETIRALHELGSSKGGHDEAALFEEALRRSKARYGDDDPLTLQMAYSCAILIDEAYRHDEAMAMLREILARQERVLGPKHRDTLRTRHGIAVIQQRDDPYEALRTALPALNDAVEGLGATDTDTLSFRTLCGLCYMKMEDARRAEATMRPVLATFTEQYGKEHYLVTRTAFYYHQACRNNGDFALASDVFRTHLRWLLIAHLQERNRPLSAIQTQVAENLCRAASYELARQREDARLYRMKKDYEAARGLSELSYELCDAIEYRYAPSEVLAVVTAELLDDLKRTGGADAAAAFARDRLAWLCEVDPRGLPRRPKKLHRKVRRLVARSRGSPPA